MNINDYFDKIFCINLDRRTDRWKQCLKEFAKYNIQVEKYSAIDGKKIKNISNWMTGPRIGCCRSHAHILKMMVQNRFKKILILEDDIEFIENFQEIFCERIKLVPEYDMLYLCGNNPKNVEIINEYVKKTTAALSTGAYAISAEFAKKMIPKIETLKEPVDCMYSENTPNAKCYIFSPYLCRQKTGFSDIENKITDYSGVINF